MSEGRCSSEVEQRFCKAKAGIARFPIGSHMPAFYSALSYREKQSKITKSNWKKGIYDSKIRLLQVKNCRYCNKPFKIKPYDLKIFCSKSCAASFNNKGKVKSEETRNKIALSLFGNKSPFLGIEKVKRIKIICEHCKKTFSVLPYLAKKRRFCSVDCSIKTTGRQTTSPKASKGKPGVRPDIDKKICFYSTWEANIARVFNLVGITWEYAPKIFDLGVHTYRPDFYLTKDDLFVEIKNFMGTFSLERDQMFRKMYPNVKLDVLSK